MNKVRRSMSPNRTCISQASIHPPRLREYCAKSGNYVNAEVVDEYWKTMFSGNDTAIDSWTQYSCVHKTGRITKGSRGPTPGNVGSQWILQEGLSLCSVVEQLIRCPCLRELCEKEGVKILRVSGDERHQGKNAFRYNRTEADTNSEKLWQHA